MFLLKFIKKSNAKIKIFSESDLVNNIYRKKIDSNYKIFFCLKNLKNFIFMLKNKLPCILKTINKRIFYCIPKKNIKEFYFYSQKPKINKQFLSYLEKNYKKQINEIKKIKVKKIVLLDPKKEIAEQKNVQIIIKNHPNSKQIKFQKKAIVIPKEIPFEYCQNLFGLSHLKKYNFENHSSLQFEKLKII